MTIEKLLDEILAREGGYVDHPADKGGPTKFGITQGTLSDWRGYSVTPEEVKALTEKEARQIYEKRYWRDPHLYRLHDEQVQAVVLDCAVNHGPKQAVKLLQKALGVEEDGVLGPATASAANMLGSAFLAARVLTNRVRFFGRLITKNPSQAVFAAGWLNRTADMLDEVLK